MNLSDDPSAIVVKEMFDGPTIMKVEPTDYALLVSGGGICGPLGVSIEHDR